MSPRGDQGKRRGALRVCRAPHRVVRSVDIDQRVQTIASHCQTAADWWFRPAEGVDVMSNQVVRVSPIVAVCIAAAFAVQGAGTASADTTRGTLSNGGRTGTVYVTKGGTSCSQAT